MSDPAVIVALDYSDAAAALSLCHRLDPSRCRVKVGKELFTRAGPAVVEALHTRGFEVFLDLKFHDIPNTVAGAVRSAAELGVWMVNVHGSGGRRMLTAAREALERSRERPLLTAVTVLTSFADEDLSEIGVPGGCEAQVMRLAGLAHGCGLDGVVCSGAEAGGLLDRFGPRFCRVTPGIRLPGDRTGDQRRVLTPAAALAGGSSHLVVGRSITAAPDPALALEAVYADLRRGPVP